MASKRQVLPALLVSAFTAPSAAAASASLWVQAPMDVKTGAMHLDKLETVNSQPAFSLPLSIPYAQLEPVIRQQIKAVADQTKTGTAVCTDPCPDVDWKVKSVADFAFTQTGQPTVVSIGNANENRVEVSVHSQARIKLDVDVHAETWFDSADVKVPIEIVVGIQAKSRIKLWPDVKHESLVIDLTLDGSNINLQGLNGEAIELGAKLGAILGSTPLGIALGGPLLSVLGAVIGNAGADIAKAQIEKAIAARLDAALGQAETQLVNALSPILGAAAVQANQVKNNLLSQPLPGINQSLNQLASAWGVSLDVRSHVTPSQLLRTVATTRFSAAAGPSAISGALRLPKSQCVYAVLSDKYIGTVHIPIDVIDTNQDLGNKIGQPCSALFGSGDLERSAYLGESPEKRLLSGKPANQLPSWQPTGIVSYPGVLSQGNGYYQCSYQVSYLPKASILELEVPQSSNLGQRLGDAFAYDERLFVVNVGGTNRVFKADLSLMRGSGPSLGGAGPETLDDCPVYQSSSGQPFEEEPRHDLKWRFDPETCPQCGVRQVLDHGQYVYEIQNVGAFLQTPLGQQVQKQFAIQR